MSTSTPPAHKPAEKPAEKAPETVEPTPTEKLVAAITAKPEGDRTSAERQILRAVALENERGAILERISKNRTYLRLMRDNEELNANEADVVDTFYPDKEKGSVRSEDDIKATRLAREAARKSVKPSKTAA